METRTVLKSAGRSLLASTFFGAGLEKLLQPKKTEAYMAYKQIPHTPLLRMAAAMTELSGAASLFFNLKPKWGASALAAFLVPTTLLFHDFWNYKEGAERDQQKIHFMKNISIFGGLIDVLLNEPTEHARLEANDLDKATDEVEVTTSSALFGEGAYH
ncbi:MAG: DoxX family protein [Bdellovibrionota bacterium]